MKYKIGDYVYLHCYESYRDITAMYGHKNIKFIHKGRITEECGGGWYEIYMGDAPMAYMTNWHTRIEHINNFVPMSDISKCFGIESNFSSNPCRPV